MCLSKVGETPKSSSSSSSTTTGLPDPHATDGNGGSTWCSLQGGMTQKWPQRIVFGLHVPGGSVCPHEAAPGQPASHHLLPIPRADPAGLKAPLGMADSGDAAHSPSY